MQPQAGDGRVGAREPMSPRSAIVRAGIASGLLALASGPVAAGTYGVPTNLTAAGATQASSVPPPGFFNLDGLSNGFNGGDGVHQIRLRIEVTGSTLDVMIFDPGSSGARDISATGVTNASYTLLDPNGTQVATLTIGNDTATTDNHLVRLTPPCGAAPTSCGFLALNDASANNRDFRAANGTAISPGLYELRIASASATTETNVFGVDVRVAKGSADHYNVFTLAADNGATGAPVVSGAGETAWLAGAASGSTTAPDANITQPLMFYAFVDRGCTVQTSNYDMDLDSGAGAGSTGTIRDALGASTGLTMSAGTAHAENTVTVEPTTGTNLNVDNYGMYLVANNIGSQNNAVDWRVSDFQGSTSASTTVPVQPVNPVRMYLPNGYNPTTGDPGATAPAEPVLALSARVVSGANPPVVGSVTRFAVTATVANTTASAVSAVQVTVGHTANESNFSAPVGCIDGAGASGCNAVSAATCTDASSGTYRRCTFASVAAGSYASVLYQFDYTPPGTGLRNLTGPPAALPNTTSASAQYSSAYSSATFPRTDTIGPVCNLLIDVGGTALATRATLRGLRVSPSRIEFAVGSQHDSVSFDVYGTTDATGRGGRIRLNPAPIPASPSPMGPAIYQLDASARFPYLLIEERDSRGRRHVMGPVSTEDARLRAAFERIEARLEHTGSVEPPLGRARVEAPRRHAAEPLGREAAFRLPRRRALGTAGVAVEVQEAGTVRIPLGELRGQWLGGLSRRLLVSHLGTAVPYRLERSPDGTGTQLAFEVERLASDYARANVYVISSEPVPPSVRITTSEDPLPAGATRVAHYSLYIAAAPEDVNPWMWDLLYGDGSAWPYDWWDPTLGDFDLPGLGSGSGNVRVSVRLLGRTAQEHAVEAFVNGVSIGSLTFTGAVPATLSGELPLDVLRPQGNQLGLRYTSGDGQGLVYLRSLDLEVPLAPSRESVPFTLGGYDPSLPASEGISYLIVTHGAFREQASRLAGLKRAEGYRVAVVDVERAYDRFSGGVVEANAVRELVRHYARSGRLRHVLLFGDDTFDYHDYGRTGAVSYVPSLVAWDGEFGRIPSENRYADTDGDGRPDVAIGRLPVQTADEAKAVVDKIARQGALVGASRHLVALDNQGPGDVSFRAEAGALVSRLPAGATLDWADVGDGIAAARDALRRGFSRASVVHYFGHGGPEVWADEALLSVDDVASLPPASPAPVLFTWACEAQWYQYLFGPSLGEALLLKPDGGISAGFGPVGITSPALQRSLFERVYRHLFSEGLTLGEAVRRAKAETLAADPATRPVVEGWSLIGDPALRLSPHADPGPPGGPQPRAAGGGATADGAGSRR